MIQIVKKNIQYCKEDNNLGQGDHVAHDGQQSLQCGVFNRHVTCAQENQPDENERPQGENGLGDKRPGRKDSPTEPAVRLAIGEMVGDLLREACVKDGRQDDRNH